MCPVLRTLTSEIEAKAQKNALQYQVEIIMELITFYSKSGMEIAAPFRITPPYAAF